jgi:hypothetical protein
VAQGAKKTEARFGKFECGIQSALKLLTLVDAGKLLGFGV